MTITYQQISDLRDDIGDHGDVEVFSDAKIMRIWERLSGAANDTQPHEAALGLMARQLLSNAAKMHDYSAGNNEEKLDQVYEHLKDLYDLYRPSLEAALGKKKQMVMAGLRAIPRQGRQYPAGETPEEDW